MSRTDLALESIEREIRRANRVKFDWTIVNVFLFILAAIRYLVFLVVYTAFVLFCLWQLGDYAQKKNIKEKAERVEAIKILRNAEKNP